MRERKEGVRWKKTVRDKRIKETGERDQMNTLIECEGRGWMEKKKEGLMQKVIKTLLRFTQVSERGRERLYPQGSLSNIRGEKYKKAMKYSCFSNGSNTQHLGKKSFFLFSFSLSMPYIQYFLTVMYAAVTLCQRIVIPSVYI